MRRKLLIFFIAILALVFVHIVTLYNQCNIEICENDILFINNKVDIYVDVTDTVIIDYIFIAPTKANVEEYFEKLSYLHNDKTDEFIEILRGDVFLDLTAYTLSRHIKFNNSIILDEHNLRFKSETGKIIDFDIGETIISSYSINEFESFSLNSHTAYSEKLDEYQVNYNVLENVTISNFLLDNRTFGDDVKSISVFVNSKEVEWENENIELNKGDEVKFILILKTDDLNSNFRFNPLLQIEVNNYIYTLKTIPALYNYLIEESQFSKIKGDYFYDEKN